MPQARIGGHTIEYAITGDERAPALVLIMGTAAPLTMWDDEFCVVAGGARLSRGAFRLPRHRTIERTPGAMPSSIGEMMAAFAAGTLKPAYRLEDLADDVIGLLDVLGIDRAHLLGLSQGGGVAQLAAVRAPSA